MNIDSAMLRKMIAQQIQEYGDHETQAQGGMVSSSHSSDPEFDQIADIVRTVVEKGGGLHDLKQPLEAEAFDVQATSQYVLVKTTNGDVAIASVNNVELQGDEELIDTPYGQLAVGRINRGMEEGFRGSPEEEEMKAKMSNKEFADYVTRGQFSTPDLKGDMGPIEGMEGPFQYASGAVLYYDPKAGKYYDRGQDRYLEDEEAAKLTMESKDFSNDYITRLIHQTIKEVEGEEGVEQSKDVTKAADKMKSSAIAPLFAKINSPDEFEALFKEFINVAASHPAIKKTAVKRVLINFAKEIMQQKS